MRAPLFFVLGLIAMTVMAAPAMAQSCGYTASGKWGLLNGTTFIVAGDATAKSCRGITLSLEGPMGIIGAKPDDIMTAQGAASFASNLTFVARSFVPQDERTTTPAAQMPWQFVPDLEKVTPSQTQLAMRRADGLADTVFFRLAAGQLAFLQVRAVDGKDYNMLLEGGDLLDPDL
ncbi:MAG: hypothetical protein KKH72_01735 [Alphaproteobacteria bacterium]|nr:hypothetical protein [Alphaproteobacteria bacterium]